ncbi:hypothetical protein BKA63DRAFT_497916 [Paraphoma chrysanthemicola]|nr:hypothetical protein BKA63DRAFT_497916 [Paraphoma chrysanthemicola]
MSHSNNSPINRTDWTAQDDLIAPTHTSSTTSTLERWAFATANLPSQGYHWKEAQMVQRVRRRYEADNVLGLSRSFPRYTQRNTEFSVARDVGDGKGKMENEGESKDEKDAGKGKKRKLSTSPPPSGHTNPQDESIDQKEHDHKRRRRATSPSPLRHYERSTDQEMSDAESSVWSLPGSEDESEMAYELDGKNKMARDGREKED